MEHQNFSVWSQALLLFGSIISHWATFATGGAVMGIVALIEKCKEKPIPKKFMLGIFLIFLVFAFYQTWEEQYERADAAGRASDSDLRQTKQYQIRIDKLTDERDGLLIT